MADQKSSGGQIQAPRMCYIPTKPELSEPTLLFSENCVPGNLRGENEGSRKLLVQGGKEEGELGHHIWATTSVINHWERLT